LLQNLDGLAALEHSNNIIRGTCATAHSDFKFVSYIFCSGTTNLPSGTVDFKIVVAKS
jgi:hypothetical protein